MSTSFIAMNARPIAARARRGADLNFEVCGTRFNHTITGASTWGLAKRCVIMC